jgi:type II secretory pathway pseudopilin PulG
MNPDDLETGKSVGKGQPTSGKPASKLVRRISEFLVVVAVIVVLIVLIRPAVQKIREKANRTESAKNLKQIGKAMKDYHDAHGSLPPATIYGKDGQPLYSWRVLLLPFLGEDNLYSQFQLDEAWDSPNNKPLLAKMPLVYAHPTQGKPKEPYGTYYQVFVGGGAVFELGPNRKPMTLKQIDAAQAGRGTSNTLLVIEAANPVPWTKPEDLPYAPDQPLPKLGGFYKDSKFLFLMADGSVHGTWPDYPEEILRSVIPWNPHEPEKSPE